MKKLFSALTVFLLSTLHSMAVFAGSTTDEPMREFTLIDYILMFAPLTILILIIVSMILLIKKREKTPKTSGKNPARIQFENTCTKYEKGTIFLKIYVIYILPFQMIISLLTIPALLQNEMGYSLPMIVFFVLYQLIVVFCAYHVRKNAMMLTKKGYKFLIAYFSVMLVLGSLWEDSSSVIMSIVLITLFYIYMKKRVSLFNAEKINNCCDTIDG